MSQDRYIRGKETEIARKIDVLVSMNTVDRAGLEIHNSDAGCTVRTDIEYYRLRTRFALDAPTDRFGTIHGVE